MSNDKLYKLFGIKIHGFSLNKICGKENEDDYSYQFDPIKKEIDNGNPVIISADSFYLEGREDTFMKYHLLHFILIYGYDLHKNVAKIVDHNYTNSNIFEYKEITLKNLTEIISGYRKNLAKSKYSCFAVTKDETTEINESSLFHNDYVKVNTNQKLLIDNLYSLKSYFFSDRKTIAEKNELVTKFLLECKQSRNVLFEAFDLMASSALSKEPLEELISEYQFLISILWKFHSLNDCKFLENRLQNIFDKIDGIIVKEAVLYSEIFGKGGKFELCLPQSR